MGACTSNQEIRRYEVFPENLKQQFACPLGNQLANVCINKSCSHSSLFCEVEGCLACSKLHLECQQVKVKSFQRLIQKRRDQHRQFLQNLEEMQKQMFYAMRERVKGYMQSTISDVIDTKYMQLIDGFYYKKRYIALKGAEAEEFYNKLANVDKKVEETKQDILKEFKKEMEKLTNSLKDIQKKSITEYVRFKKINLEQVTAKSPIIAASIKHIKTFEIDSKIVSKGKINQLKFLQQSLEYPRKVELIFRASEHGFKASRFHLNCDNTPHTLTIIRTEFGRTIAGYTPLAWNSSKGFTKDDTGRSFLLFLQLNQKLNLIQPDKAIQCIPSCGPVFGGGTDIAITDECNVGSKNCTHFPYSYNYEGIYSYSQAAWTALSGVPHGKYFNVVEYQIFKVQW